MVFIRCVEENLRNPHKYKMRVFLNGEEVKDGLFLFNLLGWVEDMHALKLAEEVVIFENPKNAPNFRDTLHIIRVRLPWRFQKRIYRQLKLQRR